eukprot:8738181-Pyramimonas_sp.AAC.1
MADLIPGAQLVGPFAALYQQIQQVERVRTGVVGPIDLFDGTYLNLFVAFCRHIVLSFGQQIPKFVRGGARQTAARMFLERVLRGQKLPPFQVAPLVIPHAMKGSLAVVKDLARKVVTRIRLQPARDHILGKLRVQVGKRERWVDAINSKKASSSFASSMAQLPQ